MLPARQLLLMGRTRDRTIDIARHAHRLELLEQLAQGERTALRRIAERNVAEVERVIRSYFNKLDDLEPVTRKQLLKLIREGAVTVLDVRPPDEFALGHVPGAVNIPLRALKQRLAEINPDREIVAYCRGEYCVLSFEAVALLRARGFKVRRLEEGLPEWRAAGLPIKVG
jgi:rhodanese-related sulfurtransferase